MKPDELVRRIWARDPSVWTGGDEARWLGWLDEPVRMRQQAHQLDEFAERAADAFEEVVLLGMGGSSLAPLVLAETFGVVSFHVLDTTHPQAIRALEAQLDVERTLFVAASKSGGTTETLSHLAYFSKRAGDPTHLAVVTDPGSPLEEHAKQEGFGGIFYGEPTIGGRYSALSPFGIVPAALMGVDLDRLLARAEEMREACEGPDGPGLKLGLALGEGWQQGRDKVCIEGDPVFGLWVEQLLAESTGKHGKGLVPAPGEPPNGPGRQAARVELDDPYDLGAEFYRWEFATAVAGALMEINPFDQPDVQAAKDRTRELLESGQEPSVEPEGSVEELFASAGEGDYVVVQAFIDPARQAELQPLLRRAHATGCVVTVGLGPRYLHSTGQLHKGGPDSVIAIQVVDDTGEELPIPGQKYGFGRLIRAQAAGDFAALKERGRRVARVRLEEL